MSPGDIKIERIYNIDFNESCGNPVIQMLENISENYEGDESTYIDQEGDGRVSSHTILFLAHNASELISWVLLKSLDKEVEDSKIIRTARGLILLCSCCGDKIVNTVEVPQYLKFTCTQSNKTDSLDKIGKEYGLQPELP